MMGTFFNEFGGSYMYMLGGLICVIALAYVMLRMRWQVPVELGYGSVANYSKGASSTRPTTSTTSTSTKNATAEQGTDAEAVQTNKCANKCKKNQIPWRS